MALGPGEGVLVDFRLECFGEEASLKTVKLRTAGIVKGNVRVDEVDR